MRRHAALLVAALLLAGCGSMPSPSPSSASLSESVSPATAPASASASPSRDGSPSPPATASQAPSGTPSGTAGAPPSRQPPGTDPGAAGFELPETPITAVIDQAYNTTGDPFDPADLGGVRPGQVTARWYVADDRWTVHFDGLDPHASGPLCPGSSLQTAAGFEHVSNAPTEADACEGFDATLAAGPVGVRLCGDEVLYLTAIPADAEGVLFASIETGYQTPGSVVGVTGPAEVAGAAPPEIELDDAACEVVPARP